MYRSSCPLSNALDLIGDKWSLILIRDMFLERTTFKEFLSGPEKIASNILSNRLKLLQDYHLISFVFTEGNKKVKHYYLTEKGIDLYPSMLEIMLWSKRNLGKKFNDIATEWFDKIEGKTNKAIIKKQIIDYRQHKEKLLEIADKAA